MAYINNNHCYFLLQLTHICKTTTPSVYSITNVIKRKEEKGDIVTHDPRMNRGEITINIVCMLESDEMLKIRRKFSKQQQQRHDDHLLK